eukprot:11202682-Lingulodinium_polyedra.AAC.1
MPRARRAHTETGARVECVTRAMCEPLQRQTVDSTASLCTVSRIVHNDVVESTVCCHSGSQIARALHAN